MNGSASDGSANRDAIHDSCDQMTGAIIETSPSYACIGKCCNTVRMRPLSERKLFRRSVMQNALSCTHESSTNAVCGRLIGAAYNIAWLFTNCIADSRMRTACSAGRRGKSACDRIEVHPGLPYLHLQFGRSGVNTKVRASPLMKHDSTSIPLGCSIDRQMER